MGKELAVDITQEATDYLARSGGEVTVDVIFFHSCGVGKNEPFIRKGQPEQKDMFDLLKVNGIDVFVSKKVVAGPDGIRISKHPDWRTNLLVEGIECEPTYVNMG